MGAFAIAAAVVVPVLASVLYNYGALEVLGAGLGSLAGKELTLRWYEEGLTGGGQLIFDEVSML